MGWKDSVVEKVKCRGRSTFLTKVFITKVTNIGRNTAPELWVANSVSLTGRITEEKSWETPLIASVLTARVSCTVICKTINHKNFDFLKFGKPREIAVPVKDVKVLSNKFCTWKDEGYSVSCLVLMNTSMVRYYVISYIITTTTNKVVISFVIKNSFPP